MNNVPIGNVTGRGGNSCKGLGAETAEQKRATQFLKPSAKHLGNQKMAGGDKTSLKKSWDK